VSLDDQLDATRADFVDALEQRGFTHRGDALAGCVATAAGPQRVTIRLGERWPFAPPAVTPDPPDAADQLSWHREVGGGLCLYTEDHRNGLPWLHPDALLAQVAKWFDRNAAGWPGDAPDLDLDRYFARADRVVTVLYDTLDPLVGRFIRLRPERNRTLVVIGPGTAPGRAVRRQVFGFCADIGSPERPPRDWAQLADLLPDPTRLERAIEQRAVSLLLLRYDREGHEGVIALDAAPLEKGGIRLLSLRSASTSTAVARLRAGPARDLLAGKSVAVVGCGAIGSFVVDQLVRAGVGRITLLDDDILRPGNLVRHLAGAEQVGLTKAAAVREALGGGRCPTPLTVRDGSLLTAADAAELLDGHDLVVDSTADGSASALLRYSAAARGSHLVSVCVQNDGTTMRVDIAPPLDGADLLPPSPRRPGLADAYEGGCGSPVSPTPPHAVAEAAAMAVRHACALLAGQPLHPSGEMRDVPPPGAEEQA
jgi:molybdopterin/thiamine biosynthesis adenylyltransferase